MSEMYDDKNLLQTVFAEEDSVAGKDRSSGNDFFSDEVINSAFRVRIAPLRLVANAVVLIIPCVGYYIAWPMLYALRLVDYGLFADIFTFVLVLIFGIGLVLLFANAGKGMIVSGRGIIIRRFFIFHDTIKADDVTGCEVMTGLSVYTKMGTQHFSKAIISYGENGKVSFNSNMYRGWNEMVRYLELCGKVRYTDGRSAITKFFGGV